MNRRSRLWVYAVAEEGQGQSIALTKELHINCTLIQWALILSDPAITSENLEIIRNQSDPVFVLPIIEEDPTVLGYETRVCQVQWEFKNGNEVEINYPNTDDLGVIVELVFEEA